MNEIFDMPLRTMQLWHALDVVGMAGALIFGTFLFLVVVDLFVSSKYDRDFPWWTAPLLCVLFLASILAASLGPGFEVYNAYMLHHGITYPNNN